MKAYNHKLRRGDCLAVISLLRDNGKVGLRVSQLIDSTEYDKNRLYLILNHLMQHKIVSNYDYGRYRLSAFDE